MRKTKLDVGLLAKITRATEKPKQYVREQISRRAGRLGISSLAAQLLWARELGMGTAHALARANQDVRNEFRGELRPKDSATKVLALPKPSEKIRGATPHRRQHKLGASTVNLVLQDVELRARTRDLILANGHHDRALREATTVLEDRIKKISGITNLTSVSLIGKALNPDPTKAVVVVSNEKEDQEGIFSVSKGIMQAFRNKTHHNLSNAFTQADALKFCGFIDTILAVIAKGQVHLDRR